MPSLMTFYRNNLNRQWSVLLLLLLLAMLPLVGACTNRSITNNKAQSDVLVKGDRKKEPIKKHSGKTWETIAHENIGKTTVDKKPERKLKSGRRWETEATSPLGSKYGSSGAGLAGRMPKERVAAPSAIMPKPMADAARTRSLATPSKSSSSVAEAKKKMGPLLKPSQNLSVASNVLTAGSIDDSDDFAGFRTFWDKSPLGSDQSLTKYRRVDWARLAASVDRKAHKKLQLAFVVDTTGSMGDELEYLKAEFQSIVRDIDRSFPAVEKEYAFIFYRDQTDEYLTRGMNFSTDAAIIQKFILEQSAGGGGDYPEAVLTAMNEAESKLDWDTSSQTAKVMFHIADAPAHDEDIAATFKAFNLLVKNGIRIYPVAASGVQELAEAMMRASAVLSGGRYIFLTDDSGIGDSHEAPHHPCYDVEKLNDVMVRVVKEQVSGKRSYPVAKRILRKGGDLKSGTCPSDQKIVRRW